MSDITYKEKREEIIRDRLRIKAQHELDRGWNVVKAWAEVALHRGDGNGACADLNISSQVTPQKPDYAVLQFLIAKALASGATRESIMTTRWDISGNCTDGYEREIFARPTKRGQRFVEVKRGSRHSLRLFLTTRCRRCDNCRQARAAIWRLRSKAETSFAVRTWFATLTLRPDRQQYYLAVARDKARRQGLDFDALAYGDQFKRIHAAVSPEITKFLKRLRKNTGAPFKYLIVAEAHKSGLPHYHALFHEKAVAKPLRYEALTDEWKLGFSQFKLVKDTRQATYLCKYLSKSMVARVRASLRYGEHCSLDDLFVIGYDVNTREPMTTKKQIF